jgi:hypothetical protein
MWLARMIAPPQSAFPMRRPPHAPVKRGDYYFIPGYSGMPFMTEDGLRALSVRGDAAMRRLDEMREKHEARTR